MYAGADDSWEIEHLREKPVSSTGNFSPAKCYCLGCYKFVTSLRYTPIVKVFYIDEECRLELDDKTLDDPRTGVNNGRTDAMTDVWVWVYRVLDSYSSKILPIQKSLYYVR